MCINKEKPPDGRLFFEKDSPLSSLRLSADSGQFGFAPQRHDWRPLTALLLYGCRVSLADKNSVRLFTKGYVFFFERTVFSRMMTTAITTS